MLDRNEKLKLVIEFIQAGIKDAEDIIFNINKIEEYVFQENKIQNFNLSIKPCDSKNLKEFLRNKNLVPEVKDLKLSGCMPAGTIVYTESGNPIKLINPTKYQG